MGDELPQFIVIKSVTSGGYAYYMNETDEVRGYVRCQQESVFSPLAKIEVEVSKLGNKFVHLRFSHTSKYWARRGQGASDRWIVASSNQPEEDTSKLSCTLFEPTFGNDGFLHLTHVQSGGRVRTDDVSTGDLSSRVYVDDKDQGDSFSGYAFAFVDWDTLVKMPKRVTFKGDNGKYLRGDWIEGYPYLQFSSGDANEKATAYEVQLNPDGHLRIKSDTFDKFWRRSPNWIWADSTDESGNNKDTLFWPVKVDDGIIALRNAGNNNFCKRLTTEGKTDCLNAAVSNITKEARLVVEELVLERDIYNVRYRMEDARIYDETPFLAGIGSAVNETNTASSLAIKVAYEETTSYSFSNSLSMMVGVKTTIQVGLPLIVEGQIEISAEVTNSFEWERTTSERKTAEATYTVTVPAMSRARVNYVGTRGKCSVPFSYTQRDKSSSDGQFITSQHIDGIFNGVNYYSFHFEQLEIEPVSSP